MTAAEHLLGDLAGCGVVLSACDGDLAYDAPGGVMKPALRAELTAHKAELLAVLRQPGRWARWAAAFVRLVAPDSRARREGRQSQVNHGKRGQ